MPLDAVMFDMDGLLIDTEPQWMSAERELAAFLGTQWTPEDQRTILGLALPIACQYIKERTGSSLSPEEIGHELITRFLARITVDGLTVQPGAVALVSDVAEAGLPFALVSASPRQVMDLCLSELWERGMPAFAVSVAGDEVTSGKPDPQPYLKAAGLLGADPQNCVVLEDSANGVAAAVACGATVVALSHLVAHRAQERVIVRDSLVGLDVAYLRGLLG
jgi:HAD superfamily hydrolase (TIGR01509 family)